MPNLLSIAASRKEANKAGGGYKVQQQPQAVVASGKQRSQKVFLHCAILTFVFVHKHVLFPLKNSLSPSDNSFEILQHT